ncbi:MAG TPA: TlyA family RNA methyltransferase [Bdellovibrionota bacterium]|nr:TlyA family RNA methyltransferase [Bdellovibrionota bacterium]
MRKKRLDQLVHERGLAETQVKAQALIMAGEIIVNETIASKAGQLVPSDAEIALRFPGPKYVSRGGVKLAGALDHFKIDLSGWHCLDVGASTGGFTDCLLQRGAAHVCTIDVGRGQLDPKIRNHPQVTWKESFHVNELTPETFGRLFELAAVDVSFITLKKVLRHVLPCLKSGGTLLALIKPQFEAQKRDAVKGVLRDETKRQAILEKMKEYAVTDLGLHDVTLTDSVLPGPKGNREAFLCAEWRIKGRDILNS